MYKILIAEDEEKICKGIKAMIERLGNPGIHDIQLVFNGVDAKKSALREKPDILITDIMMPGVTGLELIKYLSENGLDCKSIIISGYDEFTFARDALKLGVVDYLLKPVSLEELNDVLNKTIDALNTQNAAAQSSSMESRIMTDSNVIRYVAGKEDHNYLKAEKSVIQKAKEYVKENIGKDIDMAVVSNLSSISYTYFSKLFKEQTGVTFSDYCLNIKMEEAKKMLENSEYKIIDIAQKLGYDNPKNFSRAFKNFFGFSPRDFRNS